MWYEKELEEKLAKKWDVIYNNCFEDEDLLITRINRANLKDGINEVLDKELGIDTLIKLSDGTRLTSQEKILSFEKQRFNQLTFEYRNNQYDNPLGDWHHLASQLYCFGYSNKEETEIEKYWICDTLKLRLFLSKEIGFQTLRDKYLRQNKPPAQSNFFAIPLELIEQAPGVVLFKK